MPIRATKRGAERTPLSGEWDALICGASFAGLSVARELRATGARVLVVDRYEIGERQTSACAAPTAWLENMGVGSSIRQTFETLVLHTPRGSARWRLPWTLSTFDYPSLCEGLWAQCGPAEFETAKVHERRASTVTTDRGDISARLIVDALGWRRVLSNGATIQPPDAFLSRGLEVHPRGRASELEIWIDPAYVSPGYSWSFPAAEEVRVGVGSFDPRVTVKQPTLSLVSDVGRSPDGWQGNWIPHRLRPAVEDGVFYVGDSAGHCLPMTAEGIRTALYFGVACGRLLRDVLDDELSAGEALARYAAFSESHRRKFEILWLFQRSVRHLHPWSLGIARFLGRSKIVDWTFERYLRAAPPEFALPAPPEPAPQGRVRAAAAA